MCPHPGQPSQAGQRPWGPALPTWPQLQLQLELGGVWTAARSEVDPGGVDIGPRPSPLLSPALLYLLLFVHSPGTYHLTHLFSRLRARGEPEASPVHWASRGPTGHLYVISAPCMKPNGVRLTWGTVGTNQDRGGVSQCDLPGER